MIEFRMKPEFGKNEFCESDDDERKAKARQFIYLGHAGKQVRDFFNLGDFTNTVMTLEICLTKSTHDAIFHQGANLP